MSHMGGDLEQLALLRDIAVAAGAGDRPGHRLRAPAACRHELARPRSGTLPRGLVERLRASLRRLQAALQEAGVEVGRRRDALQQAGG